MFPRLLTNISFSWFKACSATQRTSKVFKTVHLNDNPWALRWAIV